MRISDGVTLLISGCTLFVLTAIPSGDTFGKTESGINSIRESVTRLRSGSTCSCTAIVVVLGKSGSGDNSIRCSVDSTSSGSSVETESETLGKSDNSCSVFS